MKLTKYLAAARKTFQQLFCAGPATHSHPLEVERAEHGFYIQYVKPGMVVFDVGANVGELTLFFSRFVGPDGRVHSFEANPETFSRLKSIVELVGLSNVKLNCQAIASQIGTVKLHIYDREHSAWTTMANRPLASRGINVAPLKTDEIKSTTVDAYCDSNGIEKIDLLKIDVEGAEYQVLLGAEKMLRKGQIRCCVFEFGQTTFDMGNHPDQIQAYLARCGYTLDNIMPGAPVFPGGHSSATAQFSMHISRPRQ